MDSDKKNRFQVKFDTWKQPSNFILKVINDQLLPINNNNVGKLTSLFLFVLD